MLGVPLACACALSNILELSSHNLEPRVGNLKWTEKWDSSPHILHIWHFCQASIYKHLGALSMFFIMKHFVSSAAEEAGVAPRSSQLCECRHLRRSCGRHVRLASSSRSLKVSVTGFSEENSITRSLTCAIKIGCNLRTRLTHLFLAEKQASICIV